MNSNQIKKILTNSRFINDNGQVLREYSDPLNPGTVIYTDLNGKTVELEAVQQNPEVEEMEKLFTSKPSKLDPVNEVTSYIRRFVHLEKDGEYLLIANFCILSYCVDLFQHTPYLWLQGAKGSGKTTLMSVMQPIIHNPFFASETSASALFRVVDERHPTLFLDESEHLNKRGSSNNPIFQILNSGYQKDGKVLRTKGNSVKTYRTFCLKILAGINPLFSTLQDRCITIRLNQPLMNNTLEYYGGDDPAVTLAIVSHIDSSIRAKLPEIFHFISHPRELRVDNRINLRELDKWFPILVIAKVFSSSKNNYFARLQNLALENILRSLDEELALPENMCRGILKDFLESKVGRAKTEDTQFYYFGTEEIQSVITANDPHNTYRSKAAITQVLQRIGVGTDRRRFGRGPVALYKIPKSLLN